MSRTYSRAWVSGVNYKLGYSRAFLAEETANYHLPEVGGAVGRPILHRSSTYCAIMLGGTCQDRQTYAAKALIPTFCI